MIPDTNETGLLFKIQRGMTRTEEFHPEKTLFPAKQNAKECQPFVTISRPAFDPDDCDFKIHFH